MSEKQSSFTFVGYKDDIQKGSVTFYYELHTREREYHFQEKLSFKPPPSYDQESFRPILESLLLILGISYWKTYCPRQLTIKPFTLTREQADFWNVVYTKGLGEFYYRNKIDYKRLVQFPYSDTANTIPITINPSDRSLVLLGGGKDSVVTAELLKRKKKEFSLFALNPVPLQRRIARVIDSNLIEFTRVLDPQLFDLNKKSNAYNGHVPITAIYSFMTLFASILYGYRFVVASNEQSANYGNVNYLGQQINHQWSKSFEFEQLFRSYVVTYITRGVNYFSLLRPFHEVAIVKIFARYEKYFSLFSSCNRNFTIARSSDKTYWCGQCPKCAFVFLLLNAFLSKETVTKIFGKNLFNDSTLIGTYNELLGFERFKPFECVGTPEESLWAFYKVVTHGEYASDIVIRALSQAVCDRERKIKEYERIILGVSNAHAIPKDFLDCIFDL